MTIDRVIEFASGRGDIPKSTFEMAATLLIDTIGVAAGAANLDAARIARDHAFAFHNAVAKDSKAYMIFDGRRTSIPGAAFAAATQIDNLDAHDGYNPTKGHIGCAVVPALFAFAEAQPDLSALDALSALIISYEVAARAAVAMHATVCDYHTSGAWNALGVAVLGCRLRGATSDQLRQALGIAEYHGPRSQMMREIANPTMLHDGSGMGALVGSMAALLALDGFTGAPAITVESDIVENFWSDLGTVWTIEQNYIKPYPICRWAHAALDALSGLMQSHSFSADDVMSIEVNTFAEAAALFADIPTTTSQAQYSLPFAMAVMMVHGKIGPANISGAGLSDWKVTEVLPRIKLCENERHSSRFPAARWSDIIIKLKDGTCLKSGDVQARGGPEEPMEMSEVQAKFRMMTDKLPEPRTSALWKMRELLLKPRTKFNELAELVRAPLEETYV